MTNRNIDLPSQRHKLMMDIELPRRQKFRSERNSNLLLLLLVVAILTVLYILVARVVDDQAHAAQVAKQVSYSSLCTQYMADSSLTGTAAEETLKQICL